MKIAKSIKAKRLARIRKRISYLIKMNNRLIDNGVYGRYGKRDVIQFIGRVNYSDVAETSYGL